MKKNIHCNKQDHDQWSRRSFLQTLGLAGAGSMALGGGFLGFANNSKLSNALNTVDNDRVLVIVRLFGGNDGLNTIVPVNQYGLYANARPTLKIPQNKLWTLDDGYGMPDYMSSLQHLWGDGRMKVVNSVGYPNLSHSHFKGSDIWATADMGATQNTGIFGSYFESIHPDFLINPPATPTAIEIGGRKNLTFYGEDSKYSFHASSPAKLEHIAKSGVQYDMQDLPGCTYGDRLSYVRGLANSTYKYSGVVSEAYNASSDNTTGEGYATNDIGKSLGIAARLIKGSLGTKVYMITANGYDTHTNQAGGHQELMTNLAQSIGHFYKDLDRQGLGNKVLTMCVSEFGRRLNENGAQGTDHGSAGPVMIFGGGLTENGVVGEHSSLNPEDMYDNQKHLAWKTDFRSVYESVLRDWMQIDALTINNVILNGDFPDLDLGLGAGTSNIQPAAKEIQAVTSVNPHLVFEGDQTYIKYQNIATQKVSVLLYDFLGREITTLYNGFTMEGAQSVRIDFNSIPYSFQPNQYYIYRIVSNKYNVSKKFLYK